MQELRSNDGPKTLTRHWAYKLLIRMGLAFRKATTVRKLTGEDLVAAAREAKTLMKLAATYRPALVRGCLSSSSNYDDSLLDSSSPFPSVSSQFVGSQVYAQDETGVPFCPASDHTYDQRGNKSIAIHKGSEIRKNATASFTVTFDGRFLPLQMIFAGHDPKRVVPAGDWPDGWHNSVAGTTATRQDKKGKVIKKSNHVS